MIQRTFAVVLATVVLFVSGGETFAADLYKMDPAHTSVVFSAAHWGLSYTYGFFRKTSGSYILDKQNPANNRFQFKIQTDSLDTNVPERDKHLRSPDFFDTVRYPEIVFESTRCVETQTPEGITYQVTGNLTMHNVTKPITFNLKMQGEGTGPYGDHRTGFWCQLELKRSDYGMDKLLDKNQVGDAVGITISFEGALPQTAPPAGVPDATRPLQ